MGVDVDVMGDEGLIVDSDCTKKESREFEIANANSKIAKGRKRTLKTHSQEHEVFQVGKIIALNKWYRKLYGNFSGGV